MRLPGALHYYTRGGLKVLAIFEAAEVATGGRPRPSKRGGLETPTGWGCASPWACLLTRETRRGSLPIAKWSQLHNLFGFALLEQLLFPDYSSLSLSLPLCCVVVFSIEPAASASRPWRTHALVLDSKVCLRKYLSKKRAIYRRVFLSSPK